MSSALAVAATLRVIAAILDRGISNSGITALFGVNPDTTVKAPDQIEIGSKEEPHLNVFLYTVTMNSGWRNVATTRGPSGERIARPPLAVDLHFLLSAYGATEFHPELLLGLGMQSLHEQPFLDRQGIVNVLTAVGATPEEKAMATAELDQQVEQVKIAPHDLSADELYKLWSAFGSKCRPSAAYVATVVLINSKGIVKSAPPVMARNIGVVGFERPAIEDVEPDIFQMNGPVQLTLSGSGFQAPGNMAQFGTTQVIFDSVTFDSALVTVPASVVPGMNLLKVVRNYAIGQPPDKFIADSNPVGIIVQPFITGTSTPIVSGVQRIVVNFAPNCRQDQPATLLLDQLDAVPPAVPNRYAIDALPSEIGTGSISFNAGDVKAGKYLLRIRIDGAESVPAFDPNLGFTNPQVTMP
jgi:hypothetical protein